MTLKQYLIFMAVGTAAALGVFFLSLWRINPQISGPAGFLIFYASLFLSLLGLFSLAGFVWRAWVRKKDEPHFRLVKKSFRHAALLSVLLTLALILQSQRYLRWWVVLLLVAVFTLAEIIMLSRES